jgi:hypothetical protein
VKALSVRQPWAWAIIYALEDIENRGWPIHYRGDILIHAAKTCTKKEYQLAIAHCLLLHLYTHPYYLVIFFKNQIGFLYQWDLDQPSGFSLRK